MKMDKKSALSLLFDRPKEPIFKEKGENGVIFDLPDNFISEKFVDVSTEVESRFGDDSSPHVTIEAQDNIDVTQFTDGLSRDSPFSLWIPRHSEIAGKLIDFLMAKKTVDNLLSAAAYVRDRINPQLFNYALSVVMLHRKDTKGVKIPTFVETFPDKFIDSRISREALELVSVVPQELRKPISIPPNYTSSSLNPEQKLWYFREDVGINLHHWHW